MGFPLELLDRYKTTFFDFWSLRPRRFLEANAAHPDRYLSPAQFLGSSLTLVFSLLLISFALVKENQERISGRPPPDEKALAGQVIVFIVSMFVLNSVFYRVIARWWPARSQVPIGRFFDFYCYMMALYVPMAALDVFLQPSFYSLAASNQSPELLAIPFFLGLILGVFMFLFYLNPGVAYINGVSSWRMFFATVLWALVIGSPLGVGVGIISVILS